MANIPIESLTSQARVWIFGASSPLDHEREARILRDIRQFIDGWESHGEPVPAAASFRDGRFLFVAVDEQSVSGGCGIDQLYRRVRELRKSEGVDLLDASLVFWREGDAVRSDTRAGFRKLAEIGEVGPETLVYDTTAERLGVLRDGGFTRRAADSWHANALSQDPVA